MKMTECKNTKKRKYLPDPHDVKAKVLGLTKKEGRLVWVAAKLVAQLTLYLELGGGQQAQHKPAWAGMISLSFCLVA